MKLAVYYQSLRIKTPGTRNFHVSSSTVVAVRFLHFDFHNHHVGFDELTNYQTRIVHISSSENSENVKRKIPRWICLDQNNPK